MKTCIITGASKGIGSCLEKHFLSNGWHVVGISRSTGYDLTKMSVIDEVVELSSNCDLFINSAGVCPAQHILLAKLYNRVKKLITVGSIAGDFAFAINDEYSTAKHKLVELNNTLSFLPDAGDLLMLKLSVLEDAVLTDAPVSFNEVVTIIDNWLITPSVKSIETRLKFTDYTVEKIKLRYNIDVPI